MGVPRYGTVPYDGTPSARCSVSDEGVDVQSPVHRARLRRARRARRRSARGDRGGRSGRPAEEHGRAAPRLARPRGRRRAGAGRHRLPARRPDRDPRRRASGRPRSLVGARPAAPGRARRRASARRPACRSRTGSSSTTSTRSTGPHPVGVRDWTGTRFPLHAVSSGLVLLAHMHPADVDALPRRAARALHRDDRVDPAAIRERLRRVQLDGYAWTRDEIADGHQLGGGGPGRRGRRGHRGGPPPRAVVPVPGARRGGGDRDARSWPRPRGSRPACASSARR